MFRLNKELVWPSLFMVGNGCSGEQYDPQHLVRLSKIYLLVQIPVCLCKTENAAIQDQVLARAKPWAFQDRMEQYETALWKHLYMTQKLDEMGISDPMERMYYTEWVPSLFLFETYLPLCII